MVTIAWTAGNGVKVGQVITVDGTAGVGEGIIESIDSATQLTIGTEYLPGTNISNKGYEIREKPKSTLFDSNYGPGEIFGVDVTEEQLIGSAATATAYILNLVLHTLAGLVLQLTQIKHGNQS